MRIIEFSNLEAGAVPDVTPLDADTTHLRVKGAGVVITLIQRDSGIDITINPTGEPYMHNVKTHEVSVQSTQVRVHGLQGSPL